MYMKFSPNEYILRYKQGKIVDEGAGLSFFFLERNTSVSAIPVAATDMDFVFEEITQDFQTVTVQGQISCRFEDYHAAAKALDFTVNLRNGAYVDPPIPKLTKRMVNIVRVLVKNRIGNTVLTEALQASRPLAEAVLKDLQNSAECKAMGLRVSGFSILQIRATPETARALEAKTREEILKNSDDALYERRNASIEQERRVKENELSTEISMEEKRKAIKQTELATKRMVQEENADLERIQIRSKAEQEQIRMDAQIKQEQTRTDAQLEQEKIKLEAQIRKDRIQLDAQIELEKKRKELAELKLANAKKEADAEAYRIGAVMEAYNKLSAEVLVALATLNMEPEKMIAQAFNNLATNSDKIGTLNITPDLLESLKVR